MTKLRLALIATALFISAAPTAFAARPGDTVLDTKGITYLESRNVIIAGSWKPEETITRGEFVEMVTTLLYEHDLNAGCFAELAAKPSVSYTKLFKEISLDDPRAVHLCVGLKTGIIHGNKDGTFRIDAPITVAEASQILYRAYDFGPLNRESAKGQPWYAQPMHDLQRAGMLPGNLYDIPLHRVTRMEAGELFLRMRTNETRLRQAGDLRVMRGASKPRTVTFTVTPVGEMSTPAGAGSLDVIDISCGDGDMAEDSPLGTMTVHARGIDWVIPVPVSRR
jgi:hypothetical protein